MYEIYTIRKLRTKKAFALIYTIFIVAILMALSSYIVKLYCIRKNTSYHVKNYSLKSKALEDDKEILFTSIKSCIKENVNPITYEGIKEYFINSGKNCNIAYGSSYMEYVEPQQKYGFLEDGIYFEVTINGPREDYNIKEIYKCIIEDGDISFKYILYDTYKSE